MKEIPLTNSPLVTLVDDEDYEKLNENRWQLSVNGVRRTISVQGAKTAIHMHRVIMNAPEGLEVDHKNRNRLDNRKQNLRIANDSQNAQNRPGNRNSTSRFKGVSWHKKTRKWIVEIKYPGGRRYLGTFEDEGEAASAYNAAACQLHGEFAYLNVLETAAKSDRGTN